MISVCLLISAPPPALEPLAQFYLPLLEKWQAQRYSVPTNVMKRSYIEGTGLFYIPVRQRLQYGLLLIHTEESMKVGQKQIPNECPSCEGSLRLNLVKYQKT